MFVMLIDWLFFSNWWFTGFAFAVSFFGMLIYLSNSYCVRAAVLYFVDTNLNVSKWSPSFWTGRKISDEYLNFN